MKYVLSFVLIMGLIMHSHGLVHFLQMKTSKTGCKDDTLGEIKVGESKKHPKLCGVITCQDDKGAALVYYCQRPILNAYCRQNGVNTDIPFPECCWKCVKYKTCSKTLK